MKSAHIVLYLLMVSTLEGVMLGYLYVRSAPPRHSHLSTLTAQRCIQRGGSMSVSFFSSIGNILIFICKKIVALLGLLKAGLIEGVETLCHAIMIIFESLSGGIDLYIKRGYQLVKEVIHS